MDNNSELNNNVTPNNVPDQTQTGSIPTVADPTQTASLPTVEDPTAVSASAPEEAPALEPTVKVEEPTGVPVTESSSQPDFENRMVNPGTIGDISIKKDTTDPNGAVNENLKKVEINYTPPSKAKTVALILFFIFMIAFIIFLPDITTMVNKLKAGKESDADQKITTGKLVCEFDTNTTNLDKNYRLVFGFSDNKLDSLDYNIITKGDPTEDADTLDELAERCKALKEYTNSITGVNISCDYSEGKLEEKQSFLYANIDDEKLNSAYSEAGGNNPQYTAGQDMDSIEKNMNASGYSCKRERN